MIYNIWEYWSVAITMFSVLETNEMAAKHGMDEDISSSSFTDFSANINDPPVHLDSIFGEKDIEFAQTKRRRETCDRCRRPVVVCWCSFLPKLPVKVKTMVYILQHPNEVKRSLSTTLMLPLAIEPGKCHIIRGKKFKLDSKPDLFKVLSAPNTILLYPTDGATDVAQLAPLDQPYNLVVLDGTWSQAKKIFNQNQIIQTIKPVMLPFSSTKSEYVIRTQPMDGFLSTVESTALALSYLEGKPDLKDVFTEPLRALCKFQLNYGAVEHQSKAWLIENGLYKKQLKKGKASNNERTSNDQEILVNDSHDRGQEKLVLRGTTCQLNGKICDKSDFCDEEESSESNKTS